MNEGAENIASAPPADAATGGFPDLGAQGWSDSPEAPAPEGQTPQSAALDAEATASETDGDARESQIPRERFDQVLAKANELEAALAEREAKLARFSGWEGLIDQAAGAYDSYEELSQQMQRAQQDREQQAIYAQATQIRDGLAAQLIQSLDLDDSQLSSITPLLNEMALTRARADVLEQQMRASAFEREASQVLESLRAQFPSMDEEAVKLAHIAGQDPVQVAQRTHERLQNAIAAALSQRPAPPPAPPMPTGGGAPASMATPRPGTAEFEAFLEARRRVRHLK